MSMTDQIADLLSRIRNAQIAKHDRLDVPISKLKLEVVKLLKEEGFIKNFREIEGSPVGTLRVFLRCGVFELVPELLPGPVRPLTINVALLFAPLQEDVFSLVWGQVVAVDQGRRQRQTVPLRVFP